MGKKEMKIGFIGQGWIGKNYADDFEKRGFEVVRYAKEEPYIKNGEAINDCEMVFIAVPTPTTPEGFNDAVLRSAVKLVGRRKIAVIKSTILPGTTESIQAENPDICVLHSPEFLTESTAAYDAANPIRNIVGIPLDNQEYRQRAQEVLSVLPAAPYQLICSAREAELIKYGGNNWFYFKVVFVNMLYDLAQKLGCRWEIIRNAMAADPRIGSSHLNPIHRSGEIGGQARPNLSFNELHLEPVHKGGRGAGGHCFIKDFAAFKRFYQEIVGDEVGVRALENLERKNLDLLVGSGKDHDLLKAVYGQEVINQGSTSPKKRKKCLVTGGAGFLGSNLVDELIERGYEVLIVDNLATGKRENLNSKAQFYELDIRDFEAIRPLFEGVDYVFHAAALPRVQPSIIDPLTPHSVNVGGTLNVLKAAADAKVKKVVYSSSSSVYGNSENLPTKESAALGPISPYALQKFMGEQYCQLFSKIYNLPTVCLRYFSIYGKRQLLEGAYCLVMGIFVSQRLNGKPMTIVGDGEQRRDFTSVIDVVRANILAAESTEVGKGEAINIGRGRSYSVNEVARFVGGPTISIAPRLEPRQTLADNSLANKLLGWEPKINLPDWIEGYKAELGLTNI